MQQVPAQIPANAITYIRTTGEPAIVRTNHAGLVDAILTSPGAVDTDNLGDYYDVLHDNALDEPVEADAAGMGDRITIVASVALG